MKELFVEKYRPQNLDDFVGNRDLIDKFRFYVKSGNLSHILLWGGPGTGKTTLAKMLPKLLDAEFLYINASDENNVETVRTKVKRFSVSMGFKPGIKFVILDECDFITVQGQAALRNVMELNSNTRFILTCNYHNRIIDPVKSRCAVFEVRPLSKPDIAKRVAHILDAEKIKYDVPTIATIVNYFYPDIRKILNEAQKSSVDGVLNINEKEILEADYRLKIVDILKSKENKDTKFLEIRKIVTNNSIKEFSDLYKYLYDNLDDVFNTKEQVSGAIITIAEQEYQDAFVIDKEITFMSCIVKLLEL